MSEIIKIPTDEYRLLLAENFSGLKYMNESPKSYRWHKEHPTTETPAMAFGTAFHAAILEPDEFAKTYVMPPEGFDGRTKEGRAFKAEVEASGQIVLTRDVMDQLSEMAANFRSHPEIAPFLDAPGQPEITFLWEDAETGLPCKGRLDRLLDDGRIFGVKTTSKFNVRQFQSHAWDLSYHAQWAFYYDGAIANGIVPPRVSEGVINTSGPFDCALYNVDRDILERGRTLYRGWLRTLADCLDRDYWPGQYPEALTFRAPAYAGTGEYELEHSIGTFVDALKKEVG